VEDTYGDVMELDGGRQMFSKGHKIPENERCKDAVAGEWCHTSIRWLMSKGLRLHPDWYPRLTPSSTVAEIQEELHRSGKAECKLPCANATARGMPEPIPITKKNHTEEESNDIRTNTAATSQGCEDAQPQSKCYTAVQYALTEGIADHPEMYPTIVNNARTLTFTDVQEVLYLSGQSGCPRPCPKDDIEGKVAYTKRVEDMGLDELQKYIKGEWSGEVTTTFNWRSEEEKEARAEELADEEALPDTTTTSQTAAPAAEEEATPETTKSPPAAVEQAKAIEATMIKWFPKGLKMSFKCVWQAKRLEVSVNEKVLISKDHAKLSEEDETMLWPTDKAKLRADIRGWLEDLPQDEQEIPSQTDPSLDSVWNISAGRLFELVAPLIILLLTAAGVYLLTHLLAKGLTGEYAKSSRQDGLQQDHEEL